MLIQKSDQQNITPRKPVSISRDQRDQRLVPYKVLLIGSQKLLNSLLCDFLSSQSNFVATQSTLKELKENLAKGRPPDMDVIMLDNYSPEILKMFFEGNKDWLDKLKGIPVIIFNFYSDKHLKKWIAWGVRGVLREKESLHTMIRAIESVCQSRLWFPRQAMSKYLTDKYKQEIDPLAPVHTLTSREREVLILVAQGASNVKVAEKLFISPYTVRVHLQNIYRKIGVPNRVSAAVWAKDHLPIPV